MYVRVRWCALVCVCVRVCACVCVGVRWCGRAVSAWDLTAYSWYCCRRRWSRPARAAVRRTSPSWSPPPVSARRPNRLSSASYVRMPMRMRTSSLPAPRVLFSGSMRFVLCLLALFPPSLPPSLPPSPPPSLLSFFAELFSVVCVLRCTFWRAMCERIGSDVHAHAPPRAVAAGRLCR